MTDVTIICLLPFNLTRSTLLLLCVLIKRLFQPSASSPPSQSPCRFAILERQKLRSHKLRDRHIHRKYESKIPRAYGILVHVASGWFTNFGLVSCFPGVFFNSRVAGTCPPVTTDLIMRVNVTTPTTTRGASRRGSW